jgi:hypothetical protein
MTICDHDACWALAEQLAPEDLLRAAFVLTAMLLADRSDVFVDDDELAPIADEPYGLMRIFTRLHDAADAVGLAVPWTVSLIDGALVWQASDRDALDRLSDALDRRLLIDALIDELTNPEATDKEPA